MAGGRHAAALPPRVQVARAAGARLPDHGEARQRRCAAHHEGSGRPARCADRDHRRAGGAARDLRHPAVLGDAVRRAARRAVRAGDAARDPARRAGRVPPPAQPEPALPSRPPDRRHDARHRARHARHLDAALLSHLLDHPGDPGVRAGRGGAARQVRLALRRGHLRRRRRLHQLHRDGHRVAHGDPPPGERARFQGEHARHRQSAELRDGQVLRQRGVRGAPL